MSENGILALERYVFVTLNIPYVTFFLLIYIKARFRLCPSPERIKTGVFPPESRYAVRTFITFTAKIQQAVSLPSPDSITLDRRWRKTFCEFYTVVFTELNCFNFKNKFN